MTSILGIVASSKLVASGSYESIASFTVGAGGSSSINFTSIPSTYKHLQLRMSTNDNFGREVVLQFNSDGGNNYTQHRLQGDGSSAGAYSATGVSRAFVGTNSGYTSVFAGFITDIADYASTTKNKTVRSFGGYDRNGTNSFSTLQSNLWLSTSAITSITVKSTGDSDAFSSNFIQNCVFSLYGIKG